MLGAMALRGIGLWILTAAFGVQQDARFQISASYVGSEEAVFKRALSGAKNNCSSDPR
ncbi:hypothetical protein Rleg4DRAFT_0131 [Rhizobium leguminosarum bv. trifolii WSM2297]|uniref:Uncharacterized protein n=1 Tax=Rhizobium leguminosarum bv. trifolii WSM2297 TaxID=754762 RepID=J0KMG9_RHILT|nr:hypothetical protein Rleg4DRAFT_0131 [Rhizobium leguminosarum bv. trifolii WSM2297]